MRNELGPQSRNNLPLLLSPYELDDIRALLEYVRSQPKLRRRILGDLDKQRELVQRQRQLQFRGSDLSYCLESRGIQLQAWSIRRPNQALIGAMRAGLLGLVFVSAGAAVVEGLETNSHIQNAEQALTDLKTTALSTDSQIIDVDKLKPDINFSFNRGRSTGLMFKPRSSR